MKTVLALIFALLPLIAYGSGKPPPLVKETVYVNQDCRHCKRDRVGWFLLGVGTGVVLYESGGADKAKQWLRVKPAQSGAMLTYEREF